MFLRSNLQQASIGSENGWVRHSQQAIFWTSDDLVSLCMYASLHHNESTAFELFAYHGFAMREVSVNSTSLYETN